MPTDRAAQRARFRALHAEGCFVLPNPWDIGGARRLEARGFQAIASTSAGMAWALGVDDGDVSLDDALAHLRMLCEATELPVNADFENGFADAPAGVADNVLRAIDTGIAGVSVEDRERRGALYPRELAVQRVAASRAAIDRSGTGVLLVARCEAFLAGVPDLDEVVTRLRAFVSAGADCVFAPGASAPEQVRAIVAAVAPVPVNVTYDPARGVAPLAAAGVRRLSTGGALARAAWTGFDAFIDGITAAR